MAELQRNRGGPPGPSGPGGEEGRERFDHVAVGYTDRAHLENFIEGEEGDLTIHGPVHAGEEVRDVATLGPGTTEGTPCLVVPLVRERIDEIQREVSEVLERFQAQGAPPTAPRRAAGGREAERPRTIGETGGTARGASAGAIREGSRSIERP